MSSSLFMAEEVSLNLSHTFIRDAQFLNVELNCYLLILFPSYVHEQSNAAFHYKKNIHIGFFIPNHLAACSLLPASFVNVVNFKSYSDIFPHGLGKRKHFQPKRALSNPI